MATVSPSSAAISVMLQPAPSQKAQAVSLKRCERLPLIQRPESSMSFCRSACQTPVAECGKLVPFQKTYRGFPFVTANSSRCRAASRGWLTAFPVFCRLIRSQPSRICPRSSWIVSRIANPVLTIKRMSAVTLDAFVASGNVTGTWTSGRRSLSSEKGRGFSLIPASSPPASVPAR
jgi:hypothetical protein